MNYNTQDLQNRPMSRQSNIELLRVIAMIIIIAHHFAVHSGFEFSTEIITVNRLWIRFIQIGGKIGVDVFVLISGYFLVTCRTLKIQKIIKLWIQILTYSVLIYLIFVYLGIEHFSIKDLIKHFLPVTYSQWWFVSTYFILYLLSPYINVLLNALDKKSYQHLLCISTLCWCIIPTFLAVTWQSHSIIWFVYLYALAGYIRLHPPISSHKGSTYIIISFVLIILTFVSAVILDFGAHWSSILETRSLTFYELDRLQILLISLLLFIGFLKTDIGYKHIINIISSATFGVYLIHDNLHVRSFLWQNIFKNAQYSKSNILIPYSIMVIALVFIVCTFIELFRIYALEKHYLKFINKLSCIIEQCIRNFFSHKIFDKI